MVFFALNRKIPLKLPDRPPVAVLPHRAGINATNQILGFMSNPLSP